MSLLEVRNDASGALGPVLSISNYGDGAGTMGAVDFYTYNPAGNEASARMEVSDDGNSSGNIFFLTKEPGSQGNFLVQRVAISSLGNVGIGTTTPAYPLHIVTSYDDGLQVDGSGPAFSSINVNATNTSASPYYGYEVGGTTMAYTGADNLGDWYLVNKGGTNNAITALANGNVGIGTTTPTYPLHIVTSGNPGLQIDGSNAGL